MAQFSFKYAPNKTKKKDKPVVIQIVFSRTVRRTVPTGVYVSEKQWDAANERVVNHPGAALINLELAKRKKALQELEVSALQSGQPFTLAYLDSVLHPDRSVSKEPDAGPCFTDYMYKAIIRQTGMKLSTVQDQLKTHQRFSRCFPGLLFKDFNYTTLAEFERCCFAAGLARSTVAKHHKNLKKYLSLAAKEGVYAYAPGKHPYDKLKVQRVKGNRAFLTQKELELLETVPLPSHLEIYRKMFLFICYTGLRISDFMRLDASLMEDDVLVLRPLKTENSSSAEVHLPLKVLFGGKPYRIWESEGFDFPCKAKGFELRFNAMLKLIARQAGIQKKVSAHVGRHTFLTHVAMKSGNVFTVMALGGLRKIDTAMGYIHLAEQDNKKLLSGIEW